MITTLLAALSLFAAQDATPEPQAPTTTTTQLEEVVVEGRRIEEAARTFVQEIGAPPPGTRPARWHKDVCVSVSNARPDAAQFMIDRVAARALGLGLQVGEPGCKPNVIIMMTDSGPALANRLVAESGLSFRVSNGATNLGRDELAWFRTSHAPVRWWHVSMPVLTDTGELAMTLRGDEPRAVVVHDVSRLRSNVRYDMGWVIVIVDMSRTNGARLGALSDYVAMVALAQIDAQADLVAYPSILHLFHDPVPVDSLTDWDADYLKALYGSPENRATGRQQENDLVHALVGAHRDAPEAE